MSFLSDEHLFSHQLAECLHEESKNSAVPGARRSLHRRAEALLSCHGIGNIDARYSKCRGWFCPACHHTIYARANREAVDRLEARLAEHRIKSWCFTLLGSQISGKSRVHEVLFAFSELRAIVRDVWNHVLLGRAYGLFAAFSVGADGWVHSHAVILGRRSGYRLVGRYLAGSGPQVQLGDKYEELMTAADRKHFVEYAHRNQVEWPRKQGRLHEEHPDPAMIARFARARVEHPHSFRFSESYGCMRSSWGGPENDKRRAAKLRRSPERPSS